MKHKWKWNDGYTKAVCEKCGAKLELRTGPGVRGVDVSWYTISIRGIVSSDKPMPHCNGDIK